MEKSRTPWWLWPNLLSLDAPVVAMVWLWIFAKLWRFPYVDTAVYWVLGGLVWVIYVVDRVLDAKEAGEDRLRERHRFHWRHRKIFLGLAGLVFLACLGGYFFGVPTRILWNWPKVNLDMNGPLLFVQFVAALIQAVFTHGFVVMICGAGFFLFGRGQEVAMDSKILKNALAALTFAYGTASGAHFYYLEGPTQMIYSFEVLAFGLLCLMNLNAIDLWEREAKRGEEFDYREFVLNLPLLVLGFVSILAAIFWEDYQKPFHYSVLLASAALLMLDRYRAMLSVRLLRVLADVALLVPVPIFWWWFRA